MLIPTKFLLVTDLDNTLIGDDEGTIALNEKLATIGENFYLVYATGRSLSSYQQLCREFLERTGQSLLNPDFLITGVGSEIYLGHSLDREIDREWAEQISVSWLREAISILVKSMPELLPQPLAEQKLWKLSYFLNSSNNGEINKAIMQRLESQLKERGLEAQLIFSSNRDVDILPKNSGKGKAVKYLREKLGINRECTLVCGDSGNDITMFEQMTLGVIVSNSQIELLEWHKLHCHPDHYLAQSSYAWGILEAIAHFEHYLLMH